MYFRFFTKAMRDIGLLDFGEPAVRLHNQGIILGPDGEKMSKSRGNVVAPDEIVDRFGADTFRCYLMFIGPWSDGGPYRPEGINGISRWLNRVWTVALEPYTPREIDENAERDLLRLRHSTVKAVGDDLDDFRFNTMIPRLMDLTTALLRANETGNVTRGTYNEVVETLLKMIAPSAPHIAEELWVRTGHEYSVHRQSWPESDASLAASETYTLVVQVNGKVRDKFDVPVDLSEDAAREMALASDKVQAFTDGHTIERIHVVPRRLVNIVVK
jgi:leucyl-tRNA synthetase